MTCTLKRTRPIAALWLTAGALCLLAGGCADEMSAPGSTTSNLGGNGAAGDTTAGSDATSYGNGGNQSASDNGGGKGGAASDAGSSAVPGNPGPGNEAPSMDAGATSGQSGTDAAATTDAKPGDTAAGDASKDAAGCNTTEPTKLYLSADDSNSMASATVARGLILQGQYAYKPVRPWEFLNYYDFAYPPAPADQLAVTAELRAEDKAKGAFRLQVGVRAPDFDEATRRRFQVVLTIDTSSSMGWGTPGDTGIDRARAACTGLVAALDKGDTFSLVRWGKAVEVLVDGKTMTGKDDGKLAALCAALQPDGDSPFSTGLQTAYSLATKHFAATAISRVILVSDGGANVGQQDVDLIASAAKNAQGKDDGTGIYLMGAGVGDPWNYNDKLMNAVTDAGKGAYVFLDSQQEAQDLFAKALLRHLEVAARNVQVQVTLPPTFAVEQFYGEQISTNKDEVEPQHLAANDTMIFHQTIQSCAPDALTGGETVEVVATWEHPVSHKAMTTTWSATFGELLGAKHPLLDKGAAVVAFCDALKATQSQTGAAAKATLQTASAEVAAAQKNLGNDPDLQQIADLLAVYQQTFAAGQQSGAQKAATTAKPIGGGCSSAKAGTDLAAMASGLDLCDAGVLLDQKVTS
ncbi:MAG: VWA domain-containing protein, partial [Deltaproteobacteria bacterium]|nr:VWA domain-containing protein [Deltaproteobacteria bacterium]